MVKLFFSILLDDIIPIFLVASIGFWVRSKNKIDPRPIAQIGLAAFFPCLIFRSLVNAKINFKDYGLLILFCVAYYLFITLVSTVIGYLRKYNPEMRRAYILSTIFGNIGNYGLPLVLFIYGHETALAIATIPLVFNNFLLNTVGLGIISNQGNGYKGIFRSFLKVPLIYAVILGLIVTVLNIQIPVPINRAINLLGDAGVPVMLFVMGMQMQVIRFNKIREVIFGSTMKLIAAPILAVLIAFLLGLHGDMFKIVVVLAAMPTPIIASALASQYENEPSFVVNMCVVTTVLSSLTLAFIVTALEVFNI